jgi:hypothetical protein
VIAIQFHFEVTEALVKGLIEHGKHELIPSGYVQTPDEIRGKLFSGRVSRRRPCCETPMAINFTIYEAV